MQGSQNQPPFKIKQLRNNALEHAHAKSSKQPNYSSVVIPGFNMASPKEWWHDLNT